MKGHLYKKRQPKGWYVAYTVDTDSYAKTELPDPGKDIADYIDRHIVESMKEMANEGLLKKLQIPEISDEEIDNLANELYPTYPLGDSYQHTHNFQEKIGFIKGMKVYRKQLKQRQ